MLSRITLVVVILICSAFVFTSQCFPYTLAFHPTNYKNRKPTVISVNHPPAQVHTYIQKSDNFVQRTLTEPSRTGLQKSDNFSSYTSLGVTIRYPSTWMLNDTHLVGANYTYGIYHEIAEISPRFANIRPSFSISVISIKPSATLDLNAYLGNTIQNYRAAFPNFTLTSYTKNIIMAGNPGYEISYSFDSKPGIVLATEIGTIIEHKVYRITYLADAKQYDIFIPNIHKMIGSLRININESNTNGKSANIITKYLTPQDIAGL
jgi:hypothetical protein